ncbi:MAG: TnsA endonuclease N-terminal domain-containing protein [Chiayiivirga sp.]|jgi:hypothetical protein|nr:TnsA endonuclease N-terminal domain-containing protein [Chiayiivirga sp.]
MEGQSEMSGTKQRNSKHFKRRRRRGSYLGVTGKYPSLKNEHCLFGESFRERDLFVACNFDPTVERVDDHPFKINYLDGTKARHYTPDALLRRSQPGTPPEIVEVKLAEYLTKDALKFEAAFAAARAYAVTHGMVFRILTEQELPRPKVRNLRFLFPYRYYKDCPLTETAIRQALVRPMTLGAICKELEASGLERSRVIDQVWRLVSLQQVAVDLDSVLSMGSLLELRAWAITV